MRGAIRSTALGVQAAFREAQNFTYDMPELGAVLPAVSRDHAALAPRAAGQGARRALRGNVATSRRRCVDPRALRAAVRESCLRFYETRRAIRTASSEQVRQPLYTRALTLAELPKHVGPGTTNSPTSSPSCRKASRAPGPLVRARPPGRGWRFARPSSGRPTARGCSPEDRRP